MIRIFYSIEPQRIEPELYWSVGVSAKSIKLAVHRNKVKRLLRESFRVHFRRILPLIINQKQSLHIFIHYHHFKMIEFEQCQREIDKLITSLITNLETNFS